MKVLKLAAVCTLLGLGVAQAQPFQTNVVQNLSIQLFGVTQGGTTTNGGFVVKSADTVRVDTRKIIQVLAAATGNTFSSTSKLAVVTPVGGGVSSIQVRDGSTRVDVTGFFTHQQLSDSVTSLFLNTKTGRSFESDYSIQQFALQDYGGFPALTVHFNVNGFAVDTTGSRWNGGQGNQININVSGTGDRNGHLLILQGFINVSGNTLEVVPVAVTTD
jgi:hypothetical protein